MMTDGCFLSGPVCPDHVPDILCCGLALWFPNGLAVFPNQLHDHSYHALLKLLHTGKQILILA